MPITRREFLRQSGGATGAALALQRFGLINALAQSGGYQALVCIFLFGGNDSNNVIVPVDDYASYNVVRGPSTGLNIARRHLDPGNAAERGQHVWFASQSGGVAARVGPAAARGRVQRGSAGRAADALAVPGRRRTDAVEPLLALGPAGTMADVRVDRSERDRLGWADRRSSRCRCDVSHDGHGGRTHAVHGRQRRPSACADTRAGVSTQRVHGHVWRIALRRVSGDAGRRSRSGTHPTGERHDVDGDREQPGAGHAPRGADDLSEYSARQPTQGSGAAHPDSIDPASASPASSFSVRSEDSIPTVSRRPRTRRC